jgi:hypothetical protein
MLNVSCSEEKTSKHYLIRVAFQLSKNSQKPVGFQAQGLFAAVMGLSATTPPLCLRFLTLLYCCTDSNT